MTVIEIVATVSERRVKSSLVVEASHQQLAAEYPDSTPF